LYPLELAIPPEGFGLSPNRRGEAAQTFTKLFPGRSAGTTTPVIDLHCHILPALDDGAPDLATALAMARSHVAAGVETVAATPHVAWDLRLTADAIAAAVTELRGAIAAEGIGLELVAGAEIALSLAPDLSDEELSRLALGGGPWLLVEPPLTPSAGGFDAILDHLQVRGHRIVLAHPERCPAFQREPQRLADLVHAGVLTSITAGALVGRFGGTVQRFALKLAEEGLIHSIASDAHDNSRRAPGMLDELRLAGFEDRAEWWCSEVPAAILAGEPIPPGPQAGPAARSSRFSRLRGGARRNAGTH
jgi:protein-tyrosine phosphatase